LAVERAVVYQLQVERFTADHEYEGSASGPEAQCAEWSPPEQRKFVTSYPTRKGGIVVTGGTVV
jgi:hypothetical protein